MTTMCISRGHVWSAHPLASITMPAVCVTVLEGATVVVSGRAVRVDDLATLSSILALALPDPADICSVDHVKASSSDAGTRFDASLDDEVALQLEFERRFFFFHLNMELLEPENTEQVKRSPKRCASDVLISAAKRPRLPKTPYLGAGGSKTAVWIDCKVTLLTSYVASVRRRKAGSRLFIFKYKY